MAFIPVLLLSYYCENLMISSGSNLCYIQIHAGNIHTYRRSADEFIHSYVDSRCSYVDSISRCSIAHSNVDKLAYTFFTTRERFFF